MKPRSMPSNKPRVLLIEDDDLIRISLSLGLEDHGFEVVEAATGEAGIDLLAGGMDAPVVVTDIDLGAGCDGFAVARQVHQRWPDRAVVFISGRIGVPADCPLSGRDAYLPKPFAVVQLASLARNLMHEPA